ncbi:hypothetical protein BpHYR1_006157 [Brachionus plicatilis]|uniref:Uncharacterized protein n=1 Tax=Brachionus plicatilis TaxID=10195 RepID=A0A3M7RAI2_BRAPC|nr:hypothetical protein BpHYR1_006157 [Brachionus plicatilis]
MHKSAREKECSHSLSHSLVSLEFNIISSNFSTSLISKLVLKFIPFILKLVPKLWKISNALNS